MYGYCCIFKSVLFIHMWLHLVNVVYQNSRKCWGRYLYCLISLFDIFFPVKLYLREYLKRVITRPYDFVYSILSFLIKLPWGNVQMLTTHLASAVQQR